MRDKYVRYMKYQGDNPAKETVFLEDCPNGMYKVSGFFIVSQYFRSIDLALDYLDYEGYVKVEN